MEFIEISLIARNEQYEKIRPEYPNGFINKLISIMDLMLTTSTRKWCGYRKCDYAFN